MFIVVRYKTRLQSVESELAQCQESHNDLQV